MSEAPQITDRAALLQHRARVRGAAALFLHQEALADIQDRLSIINKSFQSAAIVTPFPNMWESSFPNAKLVPDDDVLALNKADHDLIVHAMGLHWSNDPVGQLIQCRHALKPDGLLLVVFPGGQTLHELRAVLAQAEIDLTGGLSPRVLPMGDIRDLGALLQRAGLALPVADGTVLTTSYESPLHLMRDLRAMGETNALTGRLKNFARRDVLLRALQLYSETYPAEGSRITATFELITLTGWAPDVSQPQPLRPGSAAQRLADALNTQETTLKD